MDESKMENEMEEKFAIPAVGAIIVKRVGDDDFIRRLFHYFEYFSM